MQVWTIVCGHTFATASGSPFEAVADEEEHLGHAAVLQVDQYAHPTLRALTTRAHPQAQDVLVAVHRDPDGGVDRPVGDLPLADLDVEGVDEHRRTESSGRPDH